MPVSDPPRKRRPKKPALNTKQAKALDAVQELHQLAADCQTMINQVSSIHPMLRNKDIIKHADNEQLMDLSSIFMKDLQGAVDKLGEMRQQIPLSINPNKPGELMACLSLGTAFDEWIVNFTGVVLPSFQNLTTVLAVAEEKANQAETTVEVEDERSE